MQTPERVAIVTGAAGGIGSATVSMLAERGYAVLGVDLRPSSLPTSRNVAHVIADVRDKNDMDRAIAEAVGRWERIDVAVAGAAIIKGGRPVWETPDVDLNDLWRTDVLGVWNTAKATIPQMLHGPDPHGCRFVALASAAGTYGLHHLAGYSAVKHAVVGLVKGLAADLVATGVTAVAVSPGSTNTQMLTDTAALYGLPETVSFASHQLLRRVLQPEEVAAAIAFCCSKDGAVLNGGVIHADGGFRP